MVVTLLAILSRIEKIKVIKITTIVLLLLCLVYDIVILSLACFCKKANESRRQQIQKYIPALRISHIILGALLVIFLIITRFI